MLLKRCYQCLLEDTVPSEKEDDQLTLDLIVNAVFFNEPYLNTELKKRFPAEEDIYSEFDQDTIIDKLMSDKDLEAAEAAALYSKFMDSIYGK